MKKKYKKIEGPRSHDDDIKEEVFNDRFKRLKYAFGVHSDSDLAKALGITQQAVYAAKQRQSIPSKWLDVALSKNVSTKYILEGGDPVNDSSFVQRPGRAGRFSSLPEDMVDNKTTKDRFGDETKVAKLLVEYVMKVSNETLDPSTELFILHNVRRFILPNVVAQINDEIVELNKIMEGDNS